MIGGATVQVMAKRTVDPFVVRGVIERFIEAGMVAVDGEQVFISGAVALSPEELAVMGKFVELATPAPGSKA